MADPKTQLPPQIQEQLQQQLRDVQMPADIAWWPLAIGWWIIIAIVLIGLTALLIKLRNRRRQNRYRNVAAGELEQHFTLWQKDQNTASYLQSANNILKRCMAHIESTQLVRSHSYTSLSGQPWLDVLNRFNKTALSTDCQTALATLAYSENPDCDVTTINDELREWLRHHSALDRANAPTPKLHGDSHA
jgi:hypothetical protein